MRNKLRGLFQNKNGYVVIWQWPNFPLLAWAMCGLASRIVGGETLQTSLGELSRAFLFVWAYLELIQGASFFRRILGLVVLATIVNSLFT